MCTKPLAHPTASRRGSVALCCMQVTMLQKLWSGAQRPWRKLHELTVLPDAANSTPSSCMDLPSLIGVEGGAGCSVTAAGVGGRERHSLCTDSGLHVRLVAGEWRQRHMHMW